MLILKLFTAESRDDIKAKGGSFSWKLNTAKANLCTYAVLYHNARSRLGPKASAHRAGFLVGRIAAFRPEPEGRHAVIFDGVAELPTRDEWPMGHQNPVNYAEVDDEQFAKLEFEPLEVTAQQTLRVDAPNGGLTIAQAKAGLAAFYGVAPEAIEITIRG